MNLYYIYVIKVYFGIGVVRFLIRIFFIIKLYNYVKMFRFINFLFEKI